MRCFSLAEAASLAALLVGVATQPLTSQGSVVTIGKASFYVPAASAASVPAGSVAIPGSTDLVPITVVAATGATYHDKDLNSTVRTYLQKDDVFSQAFLHAVFVKSPTGKLNVSLGPTPAFSVLDAKLDLPVGPYVFSKSTGTFHIPYRLYADTQCSFTQGVIAGSNGTYYPLPASLPDASSMAVGVPSKLYYQKTAELPLSGVRLGVKDLYDIKGVRTGAGSRAYYDIYGEANSTAPAIQKLVDAGAVVVGKMKTTQFAMPEFAELAVDYQAPFNARGDGYQDPGSSSLGPGSGMSSYDWLDLAIGSDTGGSIRVPGQVNGLYGNRPTHGLVELTDVLPLAPQFDTAGFLARDPALWRTAAKVLYSGNLKANHTAYPHKIQTFGLPAANSSGLTDAEVMVLKFVSDLADYLSANVTAVNYSQMWSETHPRNASADLESFLGYAWLGISVKEQINLVRTSFFADYAAKYNGREPYVNPVALQYWNWGLTFNETIADMVVVKTTFMNWWNTKILPNHVDTCSDSLAIYVGANALGVQGEPSYRYAQTGNLPLVTGLLAGLFVAPFTEVTDVVLPIGQVPYFSNVTQRQEYLPVTVDLMAARGCDAMVLDLVNDLVKAGLLAVLKTGMSILESGPIYI